jgi:hypothetical protein
MFLILAVSDSPLQILTGLSNLLHPPEIVTNDTYLLQNKTKNAKDIFINPRHFTGISRRLGCLYFQFDQNNQTSQFIKKYFLGKFCMHAGDFGMDILHEKQED